MMSDNETTIFVAARDADMEGCSLPYIAFRTKDEALAWRGAQEYHYAITEVPIFPNLPTHDYWDQVEV